MRYDARTIGALRTAGMLGSIASVKLATVNLAGQTSVTLPVVYGSALFISSAFQQQLKAQGVVAVITSVIRTSTTLSFYKPPTPQKVSTFFDPNAPITTNPPSGSTLTAVTVSNVVLAASPSGGGGSGGSGGRGRLF